MGRQVQFPRSSFQSKKAPCAFNLAYEITPNYEIVLSSSYSVYSERTPTNRTYLVRRRIFKPAMASDPSAIEFEFSPIGQTSRHR